MRKRLNVYSPEVNRKKSVFCSRGYKPLALVLPECSVWSIVYSWQKVKIYSQDVSSIWGEQTLQLWDLEYGDQRHRFGPKMETSGWWLNSGIKARESVQSNVLIRRGQYFKTRDTEGQMALWQNKVKGPQGHKYWRREKVIEQKHTGLGGGTRWWIRLLMFFFHFICF